ncbi:MAG: export ABC transporter ATP-binding protein, partial [Chloroflexota bacterium]|nr:export ABC transporter ATP-binding protein [Chloroflexota bacterium]
IPAVKNITQQDGKLVIHAHQVQHALVGILEIISKIGARIKSVEVLEPNLEAVFLHMTGKKLRNS